MVEMTEAAWILNRATSSSLVLIDEIGRGTSTFDGLALAWAIAHRLAEHNRGLTLFATHYFELTALPSEIEGCANVHFDAVETRGRQGPGIVFMHHVEDGPANRSYGLQVARLAGIPGDTLRQAQRYFARLDKFNARDDAQHDLFAAAGAAIPSGPDAAPAGAQTSPCGDAVAARLATIDLDAMSPRDAQAALYELKSLLGR
jgi:DNA mismatch repair protein MutS